MPLVAGVDSSTQSTTVEVRDADTGEVVGRASCPHPGTRRADRPHASEADPADWWQAFEGAWAGAAGDRAADVRAVSVAGQQHGLVALDADRAVIRPAKLWNDTESAPDAGWLWKQVDGGRGAWADLVGSVPLAAFTVTKLSWLHRSEPDAWARLAHVLLPHDWLTSRLTGELVTDRGDASGTGYWSAASGEYRWDVLAIVDRDLDWATVVPRVLGPLDAAGEWDGRVVGPGTGDNMAGALGLALGVGDAAISFGTSGTAYAVSATSTADRSGAVAGFADATGHHLPLVCTLNAAKVLDTVAGLLGVDHAGLDALALDGGAGGLTLLPYFDGERTPDLPDATGVLAGLTTGATREQLARAVVDGVVCGLLDALDALRAHAPVERVVLTGGASRSEAVRRVTASLCDLPVAVSEAEESVAAGACVQAAAVLAQDHPTAIARRWGLGGATPVEPIAGVDAGEVRGRYGELRRRVHPDGG